MDPRWELRRSIASAGILLELAADHGIAPADVLHDTGIALADVRDPSAEITGRQELALVENLVGRLAAVPALGLLAGNRYQISTHGIWGFAAMTSPTVRDAMTVLAAYPELSYSFSVITFESTGDSLALVFDDRDVPDAVRLFNVERDFGILLTVAQKFLPEAVSFTRLTTVLDAPPHVHLYPEVLGMTPRFKAERTAAEIPISVLDLPMPQANPQVATTFTAQAAQLLNHRRERLGTSGAVRDELLRTRRFTTDQEEVARSLNMSVRTLRRRLADEGTSYREIVAETARLLAEELLASGLTVSDVAHRLGYSGAPAFTDAFRSWNGMTPGAFARSSADTTVRRR